MPLTMKNGRVWWTSVARKRQKPKAVKPSMCPDCGAGTSWLVYDKRTDTTECEECGATFR